MASPNTLIVELSEDVGMSTAKELMGQIEDLLSGHLTVKAIGPCRHKHYASIRVVKGCPWCEQQVSGR